MLTKENLKDLVFTAREDEAILQLKNNLKNLAQKQNQKNRVIQDILNRLAVISNSLKSLISEASLFDFEKLNQKKNRNILELLSLIDEVFEKILDDRKEEEKDSVKSEKKAWGYEKFQFSSDAFRHITETCLIAADIDKTILEQDEENMEEKNFKEEMAPFLIEALQLHTHVALITGNSMDQICDRFFRWLIDAIFDVSGDINLLTRVHFFCNSGGAYAHFSADLLQNLLGKKDLTPEKTFRKLTVTKTVEKEEEIAFIPESIQSDYLERTRIPEKDKAGLVNILEKVLIDINEKFSKIQEDPSNELHQYDLTTRLQKKREIELRSVSDKNQEYTIQLTLKPVPSYHFAKEGTNINHKNDYRSALVAKIRNTLYEEGFNNFDARVGGQTSIDITLDKLDKAYALEYLIDKLNLQGSKRLREGAGAHTIYLGDEVIVGGGNDYPVTRIPGLLVFAVNENKGYVPLHSRVIVPYPNLSGPKVVKKVLRAYNFGAKMLLRKYDNREPLIIGKSAIDALKKNYFLTRLKKKIDDWDITNTTNREVQILHAIVTLMCRKDQSSRGWVSILVNELDSIMELIDESKDFQAIGTSYDET